MLEAGDAELRSFRRDRLGVLTVDRDEFGVVDLTLRELLGELHTDARRRRLGVDLVVGHAEAALGAQLLEAVADRLIVLEVGAFLQRLYRRPPHGAALEGLGEYREGLRLGFGRRRPLESEIGRAGRAHRQIVPVDRRLLDLDLQDRAGKAEPEGRVGVAHDNCHLEGLDGGAHVRALLVGLEGVRAPFGRSPLAGDGRFDIGFVARGVLRRALVGERLLRAGCGMEGDEDQKREERAECSHDSPPLLVPVHCYARTGAIDEALYGAPW